MEIFVYSQPIKHLGGVTSRIVVRQEGYDYPDCFYKFQFYGDWDLFDRNRYVWRAYGNKERPCSLTNYFTNPLQPTQNELDMFEMLFDTNAKNDLLELLEEVR